MNLPYRAWVRHMRGSCRAAAREVLMNLFPIFLWSLLGILAVLVVGFLITMFFSSPEWLFDLLGITKGEPSRKYQTLKFLGIGMGGVLVALQALMSYRRAEAMEKAAQAQADGVRETEQGRRQERLKNAIEHLGNAKDSVRLGGAYELFHLARDTPERQTVLDILCAHIRQTTSEDKYREKYRAKPSEEVQSMLTLLFVQKHEVFKNCRINLQGSWLNGIDLAEARLAKADLSQAHLQRADLRSAQLQRADLRSAQLPGAKLVDAQLQRADLRSAQLPGAYLARAQLQGADLVGARLQKADLEHARLPGANLVDAQLPGAKLWSAWLQGADLEGAQLQGADLLIAQLQGVGSHLTLDASFEERIRDGIGRHSDLSKVVFAGGLSQEAIDSLVGDLPDEQARELREELTPHLDKPLSHQPPDEAVIGTYTAEAAEQWIAEYQQAMWEVPKAEAD